MADKRNKTIKKALFLTKLGFYKKAKSILIAYTSVKRDPAAIGIIAKLNILLSDIAAAETHVVRALAVDKNSSDALLAKAYINLIRGNSEEALRIYFAVLNVEPNNRLAKSNIERIKKMKGYVRKYNPRTYLLEKKFGGVPKTLIFSLCIIFGSFIIYFSVNTLYPAARLRFFDKENRMLREKLKSIYLFEGLSEGTIPNEGAGSETYTPKQIVGMFDEAKKKIGSSEVNAAVEIINKVLMSDINDYLKERFKRLSLFITAPDYALFKNTLSYKDIISNINLYKGSYVKWISEVESVDTFKDEEGREVKISKILVYGEGRRIEGIADLITNDSVNITAKNRIEVYAKVKGVDSERNTIILESAVIKHLPN